MQITDNQNETFDVVDEKDNVIGQVRREEANRNKNIIHRSISVAVFNGRGALFMQKRSMTKDTDPGRWTISCSGHVDSGDSYDNAAKREMEEELGIKGLKLKPVTRYICRAPHETEMTMLFKTKADGPFKLHAQEISEGKFFTRSQLNEALKKGKIELSFMGKAALQKLGWL